MGEKIEFDNFVEEEEYLENIEEKSFTVRDTLIVMVASFLVLMLIECI